MKEIQQIISIIKQKICFVKAMKDGDAIDSSSH